MVINYLVASMAFKMFAFIFFRYAYAVASALHDVRHILRKDFMLQVQKPFRDAILSISPYLS